MHQGTGSLDRRSFFKTSLAATAAATAVGGMLAAAVPPGKTISVAGTLPTRRFGRTNYELPVLGHGGSAIIDRDAPHYGIELPSIDERVEMVRTAYDKGVRYFDTARIYDESEEIFGKALKDVRDDVFLVTKVWVDSPEDVRRCVEESLEVMGTDYADSVQIHGPKIERHGYDGAMKQYEELVKLRDEGLFRFVGITGHSRFDIMYKLIDTGVFDTLLIEFGYFRKGLSTRHSNSMVEWREQCVARASEIDMGVAAMKVLGARIFSHNAKNIVEGLNPRTYDEVAAAAIKYVYNDPRVHVLNIGVSLATDVNRNLEIFTGDMTLTNHDRLLLASFAEKAYLHPSVEELKIV
jgi:predicted aldo/keto reductase-like oxidoreductase